ncbi:hypothetical protein M5362_20330 [Streptomyces sp. Je 1-79]|uniref:hypothetical protein n=1 Tax=Streptomyces sp. Je 1-79 TaxID=2943847 RepID=UPI0021A75256|nr:hypothetical protein [Streptomyces sp. Je 1-79]MCT4355486.1 hypothetical protein [Streptomyces sp. Je 1-79]
MSVQDDLAAVKRCLEDLVRTVGQLERSIAAERGGAPPPAPGRPENLVTIPDTPYDSGLWTDSDDEGLGARDRHAP